MLVSAMELSKTLERSQTWLNAERYRIEDESKMKMYSTPLELFFVKYHEWKTNVEDADYIPVGYDADWSKFLDELGWRIKQNREFVGICPIVFMQISITDTHIQVHDFMVRPCALTYKFLASAFRAIAKHGGKDKTMNVRCRSFRDTLITDLISLFKITEPVETKKETTWFEVQPVTYCFSATQVEQISKSYDANLVPPSAYEINEIQPDQTSILQRMFNTLTSKQKASLVFALRDDTFTIDKAALKKLLVYKGGWTYKFDTKKPIPKIEQKKWNSDSST